MSSGKKNDNATPHGDKKGRKHGNKKNKKEGKSVLHTTTKGGAKNYNTINKYDVRNGSNVINMSTANNATAITKSRNVTLEAQQNYARSVARGIISSAMNSSYYACSVDPTYIPFAFIFIQESIINAINNGVPMTGDIPHWYNLIIQGLMNKDVKSPVGRTNYAFTRVGSADTSSLTDLIGPSTMSSNWTCGIIQADGTPINGGYYPITDSISGYTTAAGLNAFTNLCIYMSNSGMKWNKPMHKSVSPTSKNVMSSDVSAFASTSPCPGGAGNGAGGMRAYVDSETFANHPLHCGVVPTQSHTVDVQRMRGSMRLWSAVPEAVGVVSNFLSPEMHDGLTDFVVKPVSLNLFIDYTLSTMRQMAQLWLNDPQTRAVINGFYSETPSGGQAKDADFQARLYAQSVICENTAQEMALMLRNIAQISNVTFQPFLQSVFPQDNSTDENAVYAALHCGTGTAANSGTDPVTLPLLTVEALRATGWVVEPIKPMVYYDKHGTKREKPRFVIYAPVWVADEVFHPNPDDYMLVANLPSGPFTFSLFNSGANLFKGESVASTPNSPAQFSKVKTQPPKLLDEVKISLVSGRAGGTAYAINSSAVLNPIIAAHNKFMNALAAFTQETCSYAPDGGLNAMTIHSYTLLVSSVNNSKKPEVKPSTDTRVDRNLTARNELASDRHRVYEPVVYNFNESPYAAQFYALYKVFLPSFFVTSSEATRSAFVSPTKIGFVYREPSTAALQQESATASTLATFVEEHARANTRARNGPVSTEYAMLRQATEVGRAGILGSVISAMAGPLANALGQVGGAAANLIPI